MAQLFDIRSLLLGLALLSPGLATAQDNTPPAPAENQAQCITLMSDFPTEDAVARYQFFKLVQDTAYGADDRVGAMLDHYGQPAVDPDTPVLSVVEDIANPVLRQAAPEIIVASMNHMIDFAQVCDVYIAGQIDSLIAFDGTLSNPDFNSVIAEDALFLRQILEESLSALGVGSDLRWSEAASIYAASLVTQRDSVEFAAFEIDIAELESLYMEDLDGRLKRSNDMINAEMDRELLSDSVRLSNDMNEAARKKAKQDRLYRLVRIFGGGG